MTDSVDINQEDITKIELNESGTFEYFMRAFKEHVQEEFNGNRINQSTYSNIYLGVTQQAMQQAVAFNLQAPINERQAGLIEAQCKKVDQETETEKEQTDLIAKQKLKICAEIDILEKELEIQDQKIINWQKQNELLDQQIINLQKDNDLKDEQILLSQEQRNKIIAETELIRKNIDKVTQDILYSEQQVLKAQEEVTLLQEQVLTAPVEREKLEKETALLAERLNTEQAQSAVLREQKLKTINETELIKQRFYTEEAQVKDFVDGEAVGGIIGRKNELYRLQGEGFLRDAEQKASKIFTDVWNVARSTDTNGTPYFPVLGTIDNMENLTKVLDQLRAGIGAE